MKKWKKGTPITIKIGRAQEKMMGWMVEHGHIVSRNEFIWDAIDEALDKKLKEIKRKLERVK